jgi:hypothetical protein
MTNPIDRVTLLVKLKEAVDMMRDVRPEDESSKAKIKLAMATVESVMRDLGLDKP